MSTYIPGRIPHRAFGTLWAVWYFAVLVAVALPQHPLFGTIVLLAFLPLELIGVATDTYSRKTLSEMMTWWQRGISKHRRFARGWNALLLMLVLLVSYLLARTGFYYSRSMVVAVPLFVLTVIWLHDHWMSPDEHG